MRTLHPYPIHEDEGDGGILLSEWKLKDDFLLAEVPGRFVESRNERNRKRTRQLGSSMGCSISTFV